jgi:hypothetical protein
MSFVRRAGAGVTPENRRKVAAAGGTARAKKMTKAQRSESARKAAAARWSKAQNKDSK